MSRKAKYPDLLSEISHLDEPSLKSEGITFRKGIQEKTGRKRNRKTPEGHEAKKDILFTKNHGLEEAIVAETREKILGQSEHFEDVKKEDLRCETEETIHLFEIKGMAGDLKQQHVSEPAIMNRSARKTSKRKESKEM